MKKIIEITRPIQWKMLRFDTLLHRLVSTNSKFLFKSQLQSSTSKQEILWLVFNIFVGGFQIVEIVGKFYVLTSCSIDLFLFDQKSLPNFRRDFFFVIQSNSKNGWKKIYTLTPHSINLVSLNSKKNTSTWKLIFFGRFRTTAFNWRISSWLKKTAQLEYESCFNPLKLLWVLTYLPPVQIGGNHFVVICFNWSCVKPSIKT